jgi:hypothetical protein
MLIKEIKNNWFMLTSDSDVGGLVWFGYTKEEVIGKFASWIRRNDLEKWRAK